MKTNRLSLLAAALFPGAVFAQTNVAVYGQIDVGYVRASGDGVAADTRTGIDSGIWGSSRLGFKGEESLGNGLTGVFTLEYGLRPDINTGVGTNANGSGNSRQTVVGVKGSFGTILAGRQVTLGHIAMNKFDPARATAFSPLTNLRGTSISNSSRLDNTMAWISPNFSGLTLGATYSVGGASGDSALVDEQENVFGLMADYTAGPASLVFVHHSVNDLGHLAGADNKENLLGGIYDFGIAKAFLTFQTDKREQATGTVHDRRITAMGVQIPVGKVGRLDLAYGRYDNKAVVAASAVGNNPAIRSISGNDDATSFGLQYSHDLSKRTMLYAGYTRVANDGALRLTAMRAASATTGGDYGVQPAAGRDSSGIAFGFRHSF